MGEIELGGGQMRSRVVRVGDTVRRDPSPWTPTVHRLLGHVRAAGVGWVPGVHGFDERGREVLDYVDGVVGHGDLAAPEMSWIRAEEILGEVARALRQWHDATATFEGRADDAWFFPGRPPFEVVAHNDFAPYNHVFREGHFVGAIDYDVCYPASRAWDAAWTAYRYVPLTPRDDDGVDDGERPDRSPFPRAAARSRLATFLEAYGEAGPSSLASPDDLLDVLPARLDAIADWCAEQESTELRRNGAMYRAHARWAESGPFAG